MPPTFTHLSCVTEELALRFLLTEAKACLETFDLLDDGVEQALDCFADLVYEDMDHEWLYDDAKDGIEHSPVGEMLGIAPMGLADWFKPFNDGRYIHPYATDAPHSSTGDDQTGEDSGTDGQGQHPHPRLVRRQSDVGLLLCAGACQEGTRL
ncbi:MULTISPECIES: hypothetical protein [unclassified Streptomyces]|uniref:hypothetical protein n=1 Tax=unclassified Streptomyces TaxID=2593676 RepID=UPI0036587A82